MRIITKPAHGLFQVGHGALDVSVERIIRGAVTLCIAASSADVSSQMAFDLLYGLSGRSHGFYRFSRNADRTLVLELLKGQRVTLSDSEGVVVLDVRRLAATFAIFKRDNGRACPDAVGMADGNNQRFHLRSTK